MTDDELRRKLGNKLGWDGSTGYPSLSELVATGEGRLTDKQWRVYCIKRLVAVEFSEHTLEAVPGAFLTYKEIRQLITAPAAVRARALLEVLPENGLPI